MPVPVNRTIKIRNYKDCYKNLKNKMTYKIKGNLSCDRVITDIDSVT